MWQQQRRPGARRAAAVVGAPLLHLAGRLAASALLLNCFSVAQNACLYQGGLCLLMLGLHEPSRPGVPRPAGRVPPPAARTDPTELPTIHWHTLHVAVHVLL